MQTVTFSEIRGGHFFPRCLKWSAKVSEGGVEGYSGFGRGQELGLGPSSEDSGKLPWKAWTRVCSAPLCFHRHRCHWVGGSIQNSHKCLCPSTKEPISVYVCMCVIVLCLYGRGETCRVCSETGSMLCQCWPNASVPFCTNSLHTVLHRSIVHPSRQYPSGIQHFTFWIKDRWALIFSRQKLNDLMILF